MFNRFNYHSFQDCRVDCTYYLLNRPATAEDGERRGPTDAKTFCGPCTGGDIEPCKDDAIPEIASIFPEKWFNRAAVGTGGAVKHHGNGVIVPLHNRSEGPVIQLRDDKWLFFITFLLYTHDWFTYEKVV